MKQGAAMPCQLVTYLQREAWGIHCSKLSPASGVSFIQVYLDDDESELIAASSAGYGFKTQTKQLDTNAKAGKTFLTVPDKAKALPLISAQKHDASGCTELSRAFVNFRILAELPNLNKGKR